MILSYTFAFLILSANINILALATNRAVHSESLDLGISTSSNQIFKNYDKGSTLTSNKQATPGGLTAFHNTRAFDEIPFYETQVRDFLAPLYHDFENDDKELPKAYQSCPNYISLLRLLSASKKRLTVQEQYVKTLESQLSNLLRQKQQLQFKQRKCHSLRLFVNQRFCQALRNKKQRNTKAIRICNKVMKSEKQRMRNFRKQFERTRSRLWRCTNPW
ncbi:hypothetical protein TrispH2_003483 [Trichoplax sp. H2]|uniref:Expressed protein n=1 Tax=Trichoplax adhaerens TaxID=10228 RepID=B3RN77_TRIAD|nr:expressed protein [Trichoplax adhaerens]EDV27973.1 expressed protein [Trichoplax adhaerens]RDD43894.1 hypothetical protein TrispH2_003483 [Trichoplax sp. H2]|eukprot:XP_002109807.1 expressed protein [Trichoplax adhaerens]